MWRSACTTEPTYDHLGSTLDGRPRPGSSTHSLQLGTGESDLDRAAAGLRVWICHSGVGAVVHPPDTPIERGRTVLVALPVGPVTIVVPNRIVAVVSEPTRFGFAYGTLPGHQERGEESFVVELLPDGRVMGRIAVDAVPATVAARSCAPVVRRVQRWAIGRYLEAWRGDLSR
jgi:uncharacterized protein (UPF0548 family)